MQTPQTTDAAIAALRNRAHTGIACAVFVSGGSKNLALDFWQGYAKALRDLQRGTGARLAAKDAASGSYDPPAVLQGAIGCLGDDIEGLTRAEILDRMAQAGIEVALDNVADLDVVATQQLKHSAVASVDCYNEHAPARVVASDGAGVHATSVGQQEDGHPLRIVPVRAAIGDEVDREGGTE